MVFLVHARVMQIAGVSTALMLPLSNLVAKSLVCVAGLGLAMPMPLGGNERYAILTRFGAK